MDNDYKSEAPGSHSKPFEKTLKTSLFETAFHAFLLIQYNYIGLISRGGETLRRTRTF